MKNFTKLFFLLLVINITAKAQETNFLLEGQDVSLVAETDPYGHKNLTKVGDKLFFLIDYRGLYKSDGTQAGTSLVKRINLFFFYELHSTQAIGISANGKGIYFFIAGKELWRSDGTEVGTFPLFILPQNSYSRIGSDWQELNGVLYFSANSLDEENKRELYRSDGTVAGTYPLRRSGIADYNLEPERITKVNNSLFFIGKDNAFYTYLDFGGRTYTVQGGVKLFKTDGNSIQIISHMHHDFNSSDVEVQRANIDIDRSNPTVVLNGVMYFTAETKFKLGLWRSDGTETGTFIVKGDLFDEWGAISSIIVLNNLIYFSHNGSYYNSRTSSIWCSNGTAEGTYALREFNPHTFIGTITGANNLLFFDIADLVPGGGGTLGFHLWRSDGTTSGTYYLKSLFNNP